MKSGQAFIENYSLKSHNTFGIDVSAKYFIKLEKEEDVQQILSNPLVKREKRFILGGGSNVLFTRDFDGVVLHVANKGKNVIDEDEGHVFIRAQAGEDWNGLVDFCVKQNYGGIENLSLIPGNAGTGPMQNIGAYGVELKDVFQELEAVEIETGKQRIFNKEQCRFGYRKSIFKEELRDQYIITSVTLKLCKKPVVVDTYAALREEMATSGIINPKIADVRDVVSRIRRSKLPDPETIGNAGSFFKNPEVTTEKYLHLKKDFPGLVAFRNQDGKYKLAAGWMIDHCGWKGKRTGDAGVHNKQALVLVNYGKAKGEDILELSERIRESVSQTFGIDLEREVNVI